MSEEKAKNHKNKVNGHKGELAERLGDMNVKIAAPKSIRTGSGSSASGAVSDCSNCRRERVTQQARQPVAVNGFCSNLGPQRAQVRAVRWAGTEEGFDGCTFAYSRLARTCMRAKP